MFLSKLPEDDLPSPAAASGQFSEKWPGVLLGVLGLIAPTSQLVCTLDEPSSELAVALLPGDPKLGEPSFSVRKAFAGDPICEEQRTSGNEIEILRPRAGVPSPEDTERSRLRNGTEGVLPAELRSSLTSSSIISSRLSFVGRGLGKRSAASDSTACSLPPRLRKPASRPMSRHKSAEAAAPSTKATSGLVRRAATYSGCARQEPWTACSIAKVVVGRRGCRLAPTASSRSHAENLLRTLRANIRKKYGAKDWAKRGSFRNAYREEVNKLRFRVKKLGSPTRSPLGDSIWAGPDLETHA